MKTPTNHEDNFMWREAARQAQLEEARNNEINVVVAHHLARLVIALQDDFNLDNAEINRRIQKMVST